MGETIPTKQFANVKPEVEVSVLLDETDTVEGAVNYAKGVAKAALAELKAEMLGIKPQVQQAAVTQGGTWPAVGNMAVHPVAPAAPAGIPKVDPATF